MFSIDHSIRGTATDGLDKTSLPKDSSNTFSIQRAITGRAKCKRCKSVINKDTFRIGKIVPFKVGSITQFFHVHCAFEKITKARTESNIIRDLTEIDGIDDVPLSLVSQIKSLIDETITKARTTVSSQSKETSGITSTPTCPSSKRKQLTSYSGKQTKMLFTNADQMNSAKFLELQQIIKQEKPLIVAICEVKPKNSSKERLDQDYQMQDYVLHPTNLSNDAPGRGIAVYTHNSISKSVAQVSLNTKFVESCLIEIRLRGGDMLLFACCYRSPTPSQSSDENNNNLNELLKEISTKKYSHRCILGDFNYKDINWSTLSTDHNPDSLEGKFLETTKDCFFHQHIDKPTRRRGCDTPSQLDLIFTDEEMQVSDIKHLAPIGKSDHNVITFNFNGYVDYSKPKDTYNYSKGNYDGMRSELEGTNWCDEYVVKSGERDVEENWSILKAKLLELRNKYVTLNKANSSPSWSEKGTVPISKSTQNAIRSKKRAHRKWMISKRSGESDVTRIAYTKERNKVKKLLRRERRDFEKGIAQLAKKNPKMFWSHTRRKLKTKSGVGPLLEKDTDKDSLRYDDKSKADILQRQFLSVFTKESADNVPELSSRTLFSISNLIITRTMVKEKLESLNPYKSCGPDNLHARLLKELASHIAGPISALFNLTTKSGEIPKDWKKAIISPIFKKGSRRLASNYRPISLTAVLCKVMESFVRDVIMKHLLDNNLLTRKQHGFISGRSTVTQLLSYLDKCAHSIANGKVVDAIYLDFEKAFDTVPHRRLLEKLEAYGIKEDILRWVKEYLHERTQIVSVNGSESEIGQVLSGVPQGTVLGPLLFVIYINDMLDGISTDGLLLADDTKLFRQITSKEDAVELQSDLKKLEDWAKVWLLRFNAGKCHVLTLGKLENIQYTHRYKIGGKELEHVFHEKDLGVYVDSELRFDEHISTKVKKANQLVGLIRRSFDYLDGKTFVKLYTALVRPHLEYAQCVWSPHLKKYQHIIEKVQMRATKLVDNMGDLDYSDRLKRLNLPTLAFRRMRGDVIELYKHFRKYDRDIISKSFQPKERANRIQRFLLHERRAKDGERGVQSNSFYYRSPRHWNNLPLKVVDSENTDTFKTRLDKYWKDHDLKYSYNL